ncbi:hypothetical protein DSO57_1015242 [Entomophthora muscae]|uniref:Uncharacterized protein n=1 Tax=Entomophthora muscae TaxID=34485 RepID=A0ACC2SHZ3_9FUNG|nr:hypothetical protein DSO57_1015242 [Entomophthora muscae]
MTALTFLCYILLVLNQVCAYSVSQFRPLRLGENPAGFRYYLPDGALWNGEGYFADDHYFPTPVQTRICIDVKGTTYCVQEIARHLVVESARKRFPSPCWFEDCYVEVTFPSLERNLVNMFDITPEPLLNYMYPPFFPNGACFGSNATMLAPGYLYGDLELYHIYMVVKLKATVTIYGVGQYERVFNIPSHSVAMNGACDSFISHKFT